LVLNGRVEVRKGEKTLAELGPGQFFGEMALLVEGAPRSADVVALEDTECLVLTRWDLRSLIQTHPDMALKMLGEMARRLSTTHQALSE
jgi:CRP/FNR family transcriptional regulator